MNRHGRFLVTGLVFTALAAPLIGCGKGKSQGDPYTLGRIALESKQYEKAVTHLEEAAEQKPNNAKVLYALGQAHLGNKAFAKSIDKFNKVLKVDPSMADAHLQIAEAEMSLARKAASASAGAQEILRHYLNAQAQCSEALEKKPGLAEAYLTLARIYAARSMPEKALEQIDTALTRAPGLIDAYLAKARLLRADRKLPEAAAVCLIGLDKVEARLRAETEKADGDEMQVESAENRARHDRFMLNWVIANIETDSGREEQAVEHLTKIIEYPPSPAEAKAVRYQLGKLYLDMSDWDRAEEQATEIQKIDQRWGAASYLRGRAALGRATEEVSGSQKQKELLSTAINELAAFSAIGGAEELFWLGQAYRLRTGRDEQALTEFSKALDAVAEKERRFLATQIRLALVELLLRKDRYDEAESHCLRVLELRPNNAEALMKLAQVYTMTGRREKATAVVQEAIQIEPTSVPAKLHLAGMRLASGQPELALRIVREAIELSEGKDPAAHHLQGTIYQVTKRYNEAVASFEAALRADASYSAAYMSLARAHIANGQREKALKLLKDYVENEPAQPEAPGFLAAIYEQLGDADRAIEYYQEALSRSPKYIPAYRIARLYLRQGKIDDAIQKWRELLAIAEGSRIRMPAARVNLALALMLKGESAGALAETQRLQKEHEAQQSAFSFFEILVLLSTKNYDEARAVLQNAADETLNNKMPVADLIQASEEDPILGQRALAKLAHSIIDRNERRLRSAEQHLKEAIELMPDSVLLRTHLAYIYERSNRHDALNEECAKMIERAPRYAMPHILLARAAAVKNNIDEAISEYQKAVKLDNEAIEARINLATLKFRKREFGEVQALASEVLALDENNARAQLLQVAVLENQNRPEEALALIDTIARQHPDDLRIKRVQAQSKLDSNQYDEVIEICDAALREVENDTVFRQLKAEALIRRGNEGDIDRAIRILRQALAINDLNSDIYIGLARIYRAHPLSIAQAEGLLRQGCQKLPRNLRLRQELAAVYIARNKLEKAEELIERMIEDAADTPRTTLLKAQLDLIRALGEDDAQKKKKKLSAIVGSVKEVASSPNQNVAYEAQLFLGKVYLRGHNDKTSATQAFRAASKTLPHETEPYAWLAPISFKRALFADSAKALEMLKKNAFNTTRLAIAKQAAQNLTAAEKIAREALALPPERKDFCTLALANIQSDAGRTDDAIRTAKTATRIDPELVAGYEQLMRSLRGADRHSVATELNKGIFFSLSRWPKDAPEHYAAALKHAGSENVFLLMFLARSLIEAGRFDEAADNLQTVIKLQPKYLQPRLDLGGVHEVLGKINDAIDTYDKALELDPKNIQLLLSLGLLHHGTDRLTEAQKYYLRLIKVRPDDSSVHFRLGLTYERQKLIEKALKAYDRAIELAPDDPGTAQAYNNAAWHYAVKKMPDLKKALAYALTAKDLTPERPEIRDTLGWVLYLSGKPEPAKRELQTAAMALPSDGSVQYHYATVLAELGEEDRAARILESAIDLKFPLSDDKRKAQDLLHKLRGKG